MIGGAVPFGLVLPRRARDRRARARPADEMGPDAAQVAVAARPELQRCGVVRISLGVDASESASGSGNPVVPAAVRRRTSLEDRLATEA